MIKSLRRMAKERWAVVYEHDRFFDAVANELEWLDGRLERISKLPADYPAWREIASEALAHSAGPKP
jgi:hypothetical protein